MATNNAIDNRLPSGILDANGNELLTFTTVAVAVNNLNISNNAAGSQPILSAEGTDADISMTLQAKGAGNYVLLGTSTQAANLKFREDTDSGSNSVGIRAPSALGADYNLTLPTAVGAQYTVLKDTDGTGTLSFTNGSQILGTATNDSAVAGNIGEYISSSVMVGSAVSLTSGASTDIATISLTAGDWNVQAQGALNPAAGTITQSLFVGISTTSNTLPTTAAENNMQRYSGASVASAGLIVSAGPMRMSVAGATTVYLVLNAAFTVSTMQGYGFLSARRVR